MIGESGLNIRKLLYCVVAATAMALVFSSCNSLTYDYSSARKADTLRKAEDRYTYFTKHQSEFTNLLNEIRQNGTQSIESDPSIVKGRESSYTKLWGYYVYPRMESGRCGPAVSLVKKLKLDSVSNLSDQGTQQVWFDYGSDMSDSVGWIYSNSTVQLDAKDVGVRELTTMNMDGHWYTFQE